MGPNAPVARSELVDVDVGVVAESAQPEPITAAPEEVTEVGVVVTTAGANPVGVCRVFQHLGSMIPMRRRGGGVGTAGGRTGTQATSQAGRRATQTAEQGNTACRHLRLGACELAAQQLQVACDTLRVVVGTALLSVLQGLGVVGCRALGIVHVHEHVGNALETRRLSERVALARTQGKTLAEEVQ